MVLGPLLLLLTLSSNLTWHNEDNGQRLKHTKGGPDLLQGQVVFEENR